MPTRLSAAALACLVAAAAQGCRLPDVNLATKDPLKVQMDVNINLYHHGDAPSGNADTTAAPESADETARRKYNRQAEIQKLKDSRLVAETHRGLLHLRETPAGAWGDYVRKTVDAENADRTVIMRQEAASQKRELHTVMEDHFRANVRHAFPGEWIEAPDPEKPGAYRLVQKE